METSLQPYEIETFLKMMRFTCEIINRIETSHQDWNERYEWNKLKYSRTIDEELGITSEKENK